MIVKAFTHVRRSVVGKKIREYPEIIKKESGVLTITAEDLRNSVGASRLKINVISKIEEQLRANNIYWDGEIPNRQNEPVRLYMRCGVGEIIYLMQAPPSKTNDAQLRKSMRAKIGECEKAKDLSKELYTLFHPSS